MGRVPAAERRQMMVQAGVHIARAEGGRAVTLARVAEACGVTKPIAYRLFDDLPDLLAQMEQHVVAGYEAVIAQGVEQAAAAGSTRLQLLDVLARTYVEHSLGPGAVYDTVAAARAATEDVETPTFALPDSYLALAHDRLGLPEEQSRALLAMFLGAADNLVAAVQVGMVTRGDAAAHLVALFAPLLPDTAPAERVAQEPA